MRKAIALLLALCLLTTLAACSKPHDAASSSTWEETMIKTNTAGTQIDAQTNTAVTGKQSTAAADETASGEKMTSGQQNSDKTGAVNTKTTVTRTREQRTTLTRTRLTRNTTTRSTTAAKTTTSFVRRTTVKRTYPATDDIVIACAGDSITANGYWQSNMQSCLSDRYTVKGYGVSGSTAMLAGYDNGTPKAYMDQLEYGNSRMSNPDIVVIMLGTNDAKDYNWEIAENENGANFKESLIKLVVAYQDLKSAPTVILATPPKIFRGDIEWVPEYIPDEINPIIREVAELTGCRVADVYAATETINRYPDFSDGIHPSTANGRKIIAQTIANVIKAETGVA